MIYCNSIPIDQGNCEQPEQDFHLSFGSKSANKIVQSTNPSIENASSQIIKELKIKNKLLNAQLAEYKTMVCTLEKKISEFTSLNRDLTSSVANQKIKIYSPQIEQGLKQISKTVPQFGRRQIKQMTQQQKNIFSCEQIRELLSGCWMKTEVPKEKGEIRKCLRTFGVRYLQTSALIDSIWKMRNMIQKDKSENLSDLWQWLKMLGWNYYYLLKEKQRNSFNHKDQSADRKRKDK